MGGDVSVLHVRGRVASPRQFHFAACVGHVHGGDVALCLVV